MGDATTRSIPPSGSGPEGPRVGLSVARVGLGVALATGSFLVLRPFLMPMAWAALVALMTWPLYHRARRLTGRPALTAGLFTGIVFLTVGVPLTLFLANLGSEATRLVIGVQDWLRQGAELPAWVTERAWLMQWIDRVDHIDILDPRVMAGWVQSYGGLVSGQIVDLAGAVAQNVLSVAITLVTLFCFYLDGERLVGHGRRMAPVLLPYAAEGFVERVGASIRAVVFGLLGTALVQGTLGGIGFAVAGVGVPVALGALTALSSFVPVGTVLVWAPAAAWLFFSGERAAAIGLALWGGLVVSTADNWLRPLLISGAAQIPFLLVFFGVLGGLSAFGILGLFLGPVLLSVSFALLAEFTRVAEEDHPA
ncbi:Putative transport protein YdiK [Myxococcaceae bacterium]|jgi:predicted PurR-regulated permease PerM|nr:Putative transport protein YdiK [Myxococcaceae bacterium]